MKEAPKLALLEAEYSRGKWTLQHPECQDFIIEEKFLEFNESNKATGKVVDTKVIIICSEKELFHRAFDNVFHYYLPYTGRVEALLDEKFEIRLLNAVFLAFVWRNQQFTEKMQDRKSTLA